MVFRRGPSKQVLMIKWDLRDDGFECGQWFKGRIYERRCDLSPDGKLLIYFASKQKLPLLTWTAISRPPSYTALALWPKGDSWNGGGWFVSNRRIRLNHEDMEATLHKDFRPGPIKVVGGPEYRGEDSTVWDVVRQRDGWTRTDPGCAVEQRKTCGGWRYDRPERWEKKHPKHDLVLEMATVGVGNRQAPWYQIQYSVRAAEETLSDLGLCDWADWDSRRGDLLYAKAGCLFRQRFQGKHFLEAIRLADFNDLKYSEVIPPDTARQWPR